MGVGKLYRDSASSDSSALAESPSLSQFPQIGRSMSIEDSTVTLAPYFKVSAGEHTGGAMPRRAQSCTGTR